MNLRHGVLFVMGLLATGAFAASLQSTDRYGAIFVVYAQVDRSDGSYRRMLTTPDVLEAAQTGRDLPDGTRILMETYYRPGALGTVFHKHKVEGSWHYGSFNGQGVVDFSTRPQASCLSCHIGAAETDFTFTKPALDAALYSGESQITCPRRGRSPCALETYLVKPLQ